MSFGLPRAGRSRGVSTIDERISAIWGCVGRRFARCCLSVCLSGLRLPVALLHAPCTVKDVAHAFNHLSDGFVAWQLAAVLVLLADKDIPHPATISPGRQWFRQLRAPLIVAQAASPRSHLLLLSLCTCRRKVLGAHRGAQSRVVLGCKMVHFHKAHVRENPQLAFSLELASSLVAIVSRSLRRLSASSWRATLPDSSNFRRRVSCWEWPWAMALASSIASPEPWTRAGPSTT